MSKIRVAVIGGGSSGITACKACLEEGFEVAIYEKSDYTGGLWRYHEKDVEGVPSLTKSTIINSSKELSAYSDFPPPPEFPNYMHNTKMIKYLDLYGESFGLRKYVHFQHNVISIEPNVDYESTGKWIITVEDLELGQTKSDIVDGVMVCTGHHVQQSVPKFKDQEKFKGEILHSHSYKVPDRFTDKNVVVVGIGNSGGDAAVELSTNARNVYLSIRRGTWITHRVGPFGKPLDCLFLCRFMNLLTYLSYSMVCSISEFVMNSKFNHAQYQIKPDHRILAQHPMVNDNLPNRILSGTVILKPKISSFTEKGVIFEGEKIETRCDVVILATGYRVSFPFISKSLISTDQNRVDLFKYMFVANLKHPHTLAMITLVQPTGPLFPIGEMQSRWFAQLMSNKLKLPNTETMLKDIQEKKEFMKRFPKSERHTIQVDYINFMDELAIEIGVKPNLIKYFFTDFKLWKSLFFGPSVSYQYRLKGPHSWSGARDAILTVNERMITPLKTRIPDVSSIEGEKGFHQLFNFWDPIYLGFFSFFMVAFIWNYLFLN